MTDKVTGQSPIGQSPSRPPVIRTPDQRLRVFVSSTLEELAVERAAAKAAIECLRLTPVMFELGARPHPPRELYRAYLDQSHVFVGIYAERYGWVAPGQEISGLEDEYRLCGARPKLIYLKRVLGREPRLESLLHRIETDESACYRQFDTPDELRELMENDLALLLTERFVLPQAEPTDRLSETPRTNLPIPRNPLVGRDRELTLAGDLLRRAGTSLVTLTGPGGCGKSRLALELGLELLGGFEGGAYLVMLESIRQADLVVPAVAAALGVREDPLHPPLEALEGHIADRHLLLVLDNFEQVVDAAPAVAALLEHCPHLVVLATSRTPLRLRGEHEIAVAPLSTPLLGAVDDLESLSQFAAVALFIERARAVRADFTVTNENAPAVAEICQRLDGMPLAIELAAARMKLLSPEGLLARLTSRFNVLSGGGRDLPERHRTLRRTIDWSHDLLDEPGRRLFRRLAVFAGGCSLEAVERVAAWEGDVPEMQVLDVIGTLLDDNMVTMTVTADGEARIGMLDTMRAYAMERLLELGELGPTEQRHASYYVSVAEDAAPELQGTHGARWATRLTLERDNIRAALAWSVSHDPELGLALATALWKFWEGHNGIVEGHDWMTALLDACTPTSEARRSALQPAAALACYVGEYPRARAYLEETLAFFRAQDDVRHVATALNELAVLALYEGDYDTAGRLLDESLAIKRELGDERLIAASLGNSGVVADYRGEHDRAYGLHVDSLARYERLGDQMGVAIATGNLALAAMYLGRLDESQERQLTCLQMMRELDDGDGSAEALERLALLADAREDWHRAAQLLGAASALWDRVGTLPMPFVRDESAKLRAVATNRLGEDAFNAAWAVGRAMSVDDAVEVARTIASGAPSWPEQLPS